MSQATKKTELQNALPLDHELFDVLFQGSKAEAFFNLGSAPQAYKGRVYLDSGGEAGWVSFDAATRAKMVSMYQYRSPSEWFAEFYATVNNANPSVRAKGKTAYGNAYQWLKRNDLLIYPD